MSPLEVMRLQHKAILGRQYFRHGTLSHAASIGESKLKVCEVCIAEDRAVFGESYWHRSHLLPGVSFCSRHSYPLIQTSLPLNRMQSASLLLPSEVSVIPGSGVRIPSLEAAQTFTRLSAVILDRHTTAETMLWLASYRDQARRQGYIKAGDYLASRHLARDFKEFYGDFLASVGCDFDPASATAWPTLILRERVGVPFTPVKHLLMQTFLRHVRAEVTTFDYASPGPKTKDYDTLDGKCLQTLSHQLSLGNRPSLKAVAIEANCWSEFRHNRQLFPRTLALYHQSKDAPLKR